MLLREVQTHSFRTASELKMTSNFPGSTHTVRRRFRERGIRSRRDQEKERVKTDHTVDRLA